MKLINKTTKYSSQIITWNYLPYVITIIFTVFYLTLSLVKHSHFLSGYDLAIADQIVWNYSQFQNPILTVHTYYDMTALEDHAEFIYILISPLYWVANSVLTLLFLQVISLTFSGIAIYKLSKLKKLSPYVATAIMISYLSFYGFQNAIWADVHSLVFAVGFLAWFTYFLEKKNLKPASLFFILAILCKEDIALLTLLISTITFIYNRNKLSLLFILLSILYIFYIFTIHFPLLTENGYRYSNPNGLFSDVNPFYMIDTVEKKEVILYSLGWFGFLPILSPLHLIPAAGDLAHYFVLGEELVSSAQGLFLHYRSSLALLLAWPTIIVISKFKRLNNIYFAIYILVCAAFFQYYLHLPISYLSKSWFWTPPKAVNDINLSISKIPHDASIASQSNLTPHLTHRNEIYTIWPTTKDFNVNSPCKNITCKWFRWGGNPEYLLVDTSENWDARHLLTNRNEFVEGISNLKKAGIIEDYFKSNSTSIYKINNQP